MNPNAARTDERPQEPVSASLRTREEEIHSHDPSRILDPGRRPAAERTETRSLELTRAADELVELLRQGHALIEALSDEDYAAKIETPSQAANASWASPGEHTRHLLDFVGCLLAGIDAQRIDYTARKRQPEVETRREVGQREVARAIDGLERIRHLDGRLPIEVRPEPEQDWTRSSLSRELQFVSTHVIHHHALIRLTLALQGIETPPGYGVAPSTLAYHARERR